MAIIGTTDREYIENMTDIMYKHGTDYDLFTQYQGIWLLDLFATVLSAASVIFGIISWIVLPKWRQFRHYAFINLLLTQPFYFMAAIWPKGVIADCIEFFDIVAFHNWLLVVTVMFYIQFVNIFTKIENIRHVYLKACLWGWLLPITLTPLQLLSVPALAVVIITIVFISFIVYLIVLHSLCTNSAGIRKHGKAICIKVTLSSFAFMFTGTVCFLPAMFFLIGHLGKDNFNLHLAHYLCYIITLLSINVFFLMLKSHRELWAERRRRAKNNKSVTL